MNHFLAGFILWQDKYPHLAGFLLCLIKSSLVVGLTWGVVGFLRHRSALARNWAWRCAMLGLLGLTFWEVCPASLMKFRPAWHVPATVQDTEVTTPSPRGVPLQAPPLQVTPMPAMPLPAKTESAQPAMIPTPATSATLPNLLDILEGHLQVVSRAGTVLLALWFLVRNIAGLWWLKKSALPAMGAMRHAAREMASSTGLHRVPRLAICRELSTPLLLGWVQPSLLLPEESPGWDAKKIEAVLFHEWAHWQRKDGWWQTLAALTICLWWWNPLVWLAVRRLKMESEQAADDVVVLKQRDSAGYAQTLVEIAASVPQPLPSVGIAMTVQSSLETRVRAILSDNPWRGKMSRLGIGMAVSLALLFAIFGGFYLSTEPSPAQVPAVAGPSPNGQDGIKPVQPTTAGIPVPPEQSQPWTPPQTSLPPKVVSAITELFNEGLADPRGCEYREIEITAALGEGDVKTHGWVLSGDGNALFAVTWSGLVYPLKSAGSPTDLGKDVADLLAQDQKMWGHYNPINADIRGHYRTNEWMAITHQSMLPIKAALLLRLGHADLAESVWKELFFSNADQAAQDPYVLLAKEWLQVAFDQASFAHMWGDDSLALAGFRKLAPLQKEVEANAGKRSIAKDTPGKPYVEGLEQLPALLADQERRAQEQPYIPVLKSGLSAQGPERIAALIRDFELVHAEQEGNPGETRVIDDPIVQAVIKEGEPAVEPLINCLEEDNRLTRSLFTFHMMGRGPMIPVYEPAYVALVKILKITMPLPAGRSPRELSTDDRKALAQQFRDYWSKNKGLSPTERWYATLRDDNAGAAAWFDAAANIVQPIDDKAIPIPRQGDALRSKSNPSVSELIIERFDQIIAQTGTNENTSFDHLSNLLFALADWDGKAHFDDLRTLTAKLDAKLPHHNDGSYSTVQTTVTIYEKRVALGDPTALGEYTAWLPTLDPDETLPATLLLMWQKPSDPIIQKAAAQLFAAKDSPWRLAPPKPPRFACDLISTPLIGLPVFRQSLLNALEDTTVVGDLFVNGGGYAS